MAQPVFLLVTYRMNPGCRGAFLRQVDEAGLPAFFRGEPGCMRYEYLPAADPDTLILLEYWACADDQARHAATAQFAALAAVKAQYVQTTVIERFTPAAPV